MALVARAHGLNANQVFKWRRAFERGELVASVITLKPANGRFFVTFGEVVSGLPVLF